jgi:hypothetical protein
MYELRASASDKLGRSHGGLVVDFCSAQREVKPNNFSAAAVAQFNLPGQGRPPAVALSPVDPMTARGQNRLVRSTSFSNFPF